MINQIVKKFITKFCSILPIQYAKKFMIATRFISICLYKKVSNHQYVLYNYYISNIDIYSSEAMINNNTVVDICKSCNILQNMINKDINNMNNYISMGKFWEYAYVIEIINKYNNGKVKIASIGCGRSLLSYYLAKIGYDITIYNLNYHIDKINHKEIKDNFMFFMEEYDHIDELDFFPSNQVPENTYNIVICVPMVNQIRCKELALKEMLRILNPGGILILTFSLTPDNYENRHSIPRPAFTPQSLMDELKKLGITSHVLYASREVVFSISDMQHDEFSMEQNTTVGGIVISKHLK